MINYSELLKAELQGIYWNYIEKINQINKYYEIYEGKQKWGTNPDLDYVPTKKITNLTKKLINTRARFMFGKEPYFDIKPIAEGESAKNQAQEKEDLLYKILEDNKFHSKLLKAKKDCSIGGRIAIKLWARNDVGLKIVFSPAQEFFPQFDLDDIDALEKVPFVYAINDETDPDKQRVKKQVWEMVNGYCILNESTHDGHGKLISTEYENYNTGLDFIPVIIVQNGGLTGETEGKSDVEQLWDNQDAYNKLTSDDIDALKFQMFGQDVVTDANEESLKNIKIAPGAMIDLQTDQAQNNEGRQAKMERLESGFSYKDKFEDTVNRIKNDIYDTLDVPNISLEQLKGLMQSGKSMKALYWGLISACEEDWTEWGPALKQMVEYIFRMIDIYNLYGARNIARYETTIDIQHNYPIQEDEDEKKRLEREEWERQSRKEHEEWIKTEEAQQAIRKWLIDSEQIEA